MTHSQKSRLQLLSLALTGLISFSCQPNSVATPNSTPLSISSPRPVVTSTLAPDVTNVSPAPTEFDYDAYLVSPPEEFITERFDFGRVQQGSKPRHSFFIQNNGSFAMTLGEVRSSISCCIKTTIPKTYLEPGESMELTVTLDSTHQGGPLVTSVVVPVDTQEHPLVYELVADVERVIWVEPYLVSIGAQGSQFKVISSRFTSGLKVTKVEPDDPSILVTPGQKSGKEQTFSLTVDKPSKKTSGFIRLLTNDKEIPDIFVQYEHSKSNP